MKPVVVLVIVLAVAGGIWWFSGAQQSADIAVEGVASDTEIGSSEPKPLELVNENTESVESGDVTGAESESDSLETAESGTSESAAPEADSGSSPFALVETQPAAEPSVANTQAAQQAVEQNNVAVEGGSQRSLEPLVVPSSYPVTDAAKYFIPKEERGPGRLGGPPPLDFPGGPSDPNRDTNSILQPPPAPGQ